MGYRVLDLFCGAGGAGRGYADAGFEVIGIDVERQPRYPYRFVQADIRALSVADLLSYGPDALVGSPPCKVHTVVRHVIRPGARRKHAIDLLPETRALFKASGLPYVIENVPHAPLIDPIVLCGSMFDLGVRRHRLFELGRWALSSQPPCAHARQNAISPGYPVKRYHSGRPIVTPSPVIGVYGRGQGLGPGEIDLWKRAMGIDWMVREELSQAIPPAYTEYLGMHLAAVLDRGITS